MGRRERCASLTSAPPAPQLWGEDDRSPRLVLSLPKGLGAGGPNHSAPLPPQLWGAAQPLPQACPELAEGIGGRGADH